MRSHDLMANIAHFLGSMDTRRGWAGLLGMLLLKGGMESPELKKRGVQIFMTNSSLFFLGLWKSAWLGWALCRPDAIFLL